MDLLLYGSRKNRYSINALLGALAASGEQRPALATTPAEVAAFLAGRPHDRPLIGAFSFFSTQLAEIQGVLQQFRRYRRAILVAGGPHASGRPRATLAMGFHYVVRGEGEATFPELVAALREGTDPGRVAGLVFRDGDGAIRSTPRRPRVDLDRWPPFAPQWQRFGPMEITRGCPFGCGFCQTSFLFGPRVRHRSMETIGHWARVMAQRGLTDLRVITPNALAYGSPDGRQVELAAVEELLARLRGIVGRGGRIFFGSFPSEVRPEQVSDKVLAILARYVDNDNLVIGAQSGSDAMLARCRRGHTVGDVERAVRLARAHGFLPLVDVIFGLPGETAADRAATIAFMERLAGLGARVHAHTYLPLPQTPFSRLPPPPVAPELRRAAESLISRGALFGSWKAQAQAAQELEGT